MPPHQAATKHRRTAKQTPPYCPHLRTPRTAIPLVTSYPRTGSPALRPPNQHTGLLIQASYSNQNKTQQNIHINRVKTTWKPALVANGRLPNNWHSPVRFLVGRRACYLCEGFHTTRAIHKSAFSTHSGPRSGYSASNRAVFLTPSLV